MIAAALTGSLGPEPARHPFQPVLAVIGNIGAIVGLVLVVLLYLDTFRLIRAMQREITQRL